MKNIRILFRLFGLFGLCAAQPALAHEVWLEPQKYQVENGQPIVAALKNGQDFEGIELGWFAGRIATFDKIVRGKRSILEGRTGDLPAVQGLVTDPGLVVLVYQSTPQSLTYENWEKFLSFIENKDLASSLPSRFLPDASDLPPKELYTRHVKSLIAVGHGKGEDQETGLETEIIALANPYRDDVSRGLPLRVLYQGRPRATTQVEVFDRAPNGTVTVTRLRTDASGELVLPLTAGHEYLVDSVVLRLAAKETAQRYNVAIETLWAALTFAAPE